MAVVDTVRQTSVRVPQEALAALDVVVGKLSVSREAALRQLVANYIDYQSSIQVAEDRITHLTTVLRYPPLPPGRRRPDPRPQLRLRLADSLRGAALQHAFLLPGQSPRHGHHDYAGRPLTDVVMTAIELAEPVQFGELAGLPGTLRRRTATGLWRLTVAATLTAAERRAIWGEAGDDLAPVLTEEDVAWHHPWRFEVAKTLLMNIHNQPAGDIAENMDALYDQTDAFRDLLACVRRHDESTYWLLHNLPYLNNSVSGRGGAAVWRAQRKLALEAIGDWSTSPTAPRHAAVTPPGWKLQLPQNWRIRSFSHGEHVPQTLSKLGDDEAVAILRSGSRVAYWPVDTAGAPITGFNAVLRSGRHLAPERLLEVVLHRLDYPHIGVPAEVACDLGFITESQRDALVTEASKVNGNLVQSTLASAKTILGNKAYVELVAASTDLKSFERICQRNLLRYRTRYPTWVWEVASVPSALEAGHSSARIAWLTRAIDRITTRLLENDMERASAKAYFLGRTTPEDTDL